jgi:hypothetical protein
MHAAYDCLPFFNLYGIVSVFYFCLFSDFNVDCKDALKQAASNNIFADSGIYKIRLLTAETIHVYCEMTTEFDDPGWTVIQFLYCCCVDVFCLILRRTNTDKVIWRRNRKDDFG